MPSQETTPKCNPNRGGSKPGPAPGRHKFTRAGGSEGFWAGLASYVEQGGEARNFLRRKMATRRLSSYATPKRDRGGGVFVSAFTFRLLTVPHSHVIVQSLERGCLRVSFHAKRKGARAIADRLLTPPPQ